MKLMIGIMHCIENEFKQCIESIELQTYKNFEYYVIEGLPNKEAHTMLYNTFMASAGEYDLFVKIDADMVICKSTFFENVVEYFADHPNVDDLEIKVKDFFINDLTYGLHVYSNRVKWINKRENLFVDRVINKYNKHHFGDSSLEPAAYHCPDPSAFQCYHFGLHKAVKFLQYRKEDFVKSASNSHWNNILKVGKNYSQTGDIRLAIALTGAIDAIFKRYTAENVDYQDQKVKVNFKKYTKEDFMWKADLAAFFLKSIPRQVLRNMLLIFRYI